MTTKGFAANLLASLQMHHEITTAFEDVTPSSKFPPKVQFDTEQAKSGFGSVLLAPEDKAILTKDPKKLPNSILVRGLEVEDYSEDDDIDGIKRTLLGMVQEEEDYIFGFESLLQNTFLLSEDTFGDIEELEENPELITLEIVKEKLSNTIKILDLFYEIDQNISRVLSAGDMNEYEMTLGYIESQIEDFFNFLLLNEIIDFDSSQFTADLQAIDKKLIRLGKELHHLTNLKNRSFVWRHLYFSNILEIFEVPAVPPSISPKIIQDLYNLNMASVTLQEKIYNNTASDSYNFVENIQLLKDFYYRLDEFNNTLFAEKIDSHWFGALLSFVHQDVFSSVMDYIVHLLRIDVSEDLDGDEQENVIKLLHEIEHLSHGIENTETDIFSEREGSTGWLKAIRILFTSHVLLSLQQLSSVGNWPEKLWEDYQSLVFMNRNNALYLEGSNTESSIFALSKAEEKLGIEIEEQESDEITDPFSLAEELATHLLYHTINLNHFFDVLEAYLTSYQDELVEITQEKEDSINDLINSMQYYIDIVSFPIIAKSLKEIMDLLNKIPSDETSFEELFTLYNDFFSPYQTLLKDNLKHLENLGYQDLLDTWDAPLTSLLAEILIKKFSGFGMISNSKISE